MLIPSAAITRLDQGDLWQSSIGRICLELLCRHKVLGEVIGENKHGKCAARGQGRMRVADINPSRNTCILPRFDNRLVLEMQRSGRQRNGESRSAGSQAFK